MAFYRISKVLNLDPEKEVLIYSSQFSWRVYLWYERKLNLNLTSDGFILLLLMSFLDVWEVYCNFLNSKSWTKDTHVCVLSLLCFSFLWAVIIKSLWLYSPARDAFFFTSINSRRMLEQKNCSFFFSDTVTFHFSNKFIVCSLELDFSWYWSGLSFIYPHQIKMHLRCN